jgi:thiol:disulfide interchange protein DsbA
MQSNILKGGVLLLVAIMVAAFFSIIGAVAANASESTYREGVHYEYFPGLPATKNTLDEYISVFCPGCNAVEANYENWRPRINPNIRVARQHVDFMMGTSPAGMEAIARAIAVNNLYQGKLDESNGIVWDIFYMVHEMKRKPSPRDIALILERHSKEGMDLQKVSTSYAVRSHAANMKVMQTQASSAGALHGVPTFIVNGQYRINLEALNPMNPFADLTNLINHLSEK